MLKTIALAAVATVALSAAAEAQQYQRRGGHGYQQGYVNNSYNRNVYVNRRGGNGNAWAAAGAGLLLGGVIGALAAQPSYGYAAPPPPPVYAPPQPLYLPNVVPGCYQTQMIDQWGRVVMGTVCN